MAALSANRRGDFCAGAGSSNGQGRRGYILTGVNRGTVAPLAPRVGPGCAELHDRTMVGIRTGRLELEELWAFVGKKRKQVKRTDGPHLGDQYTFVGLAASSRAIVSYRTGKRDTGTTHEFSADFRQRFLGSSGGAKPPRPARRMIPSSN